MADGVSLSTGFTVGGLTNGTPYSFRVAAVNAVGTGPSSATVTATPLSQPATPDGLTAAVAPAPSLGSGQVKLTWTAPSNNGSPITDYLIERSVDGTSWAKVADGVSPATGFTVGELVNGRRYSFRVAAVNALGQGPWSAVVQATPAWTAAAPSGLTAAVAPATGVGSGEVKLAWTGPASDNGSAITDYLVDRSVDGTTWTRVADGVSPATGFTVGELVNGTRYSFRVAAVNAVGTGPWSEVVQATPLGTPAAPGTLTASVAPATAVGPGEVQLTWTTPADAGGLTIVDYVIEWSVDGTTWTTIDDGVSLSTGFTVGGLTNGTTYSFRVSAVNALGTGASSDVVEATPAGPSAAPTGLTAAVAPATGVGSGQVKLTWIAPSANGSAIRDYLIQWSIDGTTWTTVDDGVSTAQSYVVTRLTNGTQYRFRLAAINAVGQSPWSSIVPATPRWKPAAPGGLRAAVAPTTGVGSRQVKLTWNAPASTGGSALTDYAIQRSTDGVKWTTVVDGVSTARSYVVARLTNGTQYRFRVAARNAVGQGPWSTVVRATPRAG